MTTNRFSHTDCSHEATKAGRLACRKARTQREVDAAAALGVIGRDWIFRGARDFGDYKGDDAIEAAISLLAYFAPSGDDAKDARRRANGYTITTSPSTIRSIILRRNS